MYILICTLCIYNMYIGVRMRQFLSGTFVIPKKYHVRKKKSLYFCTIRIFYLYGFLTYIVQ